MTQGTKSLLIAWAIALPFIILAVSVTVYEQGPPKFIPSEWFTFFR